MPEVPDLEAIRKFFNKNIVGTTVQEVELNIPIVVRIPREDFVCLLTENTFGEVQRHGKFLLFTLASGHILVVNPMLTGRFSYVEQPARKQARTCFVLKLANGHELRYADQRVMGRIYVVEAGQLSTVPQFAEIGPDILSPELTESVFRERIRRYTGQIKSILVNHKFVGGIGNAYSDEILWEAGIHPYRKRTQLSDQEIGKLYLASGTVLRWAEEIVAAKMTENLDYAEWRDHLKVHRRDGLDCQRCGAKISEITAGNRITSFCRHCQP